MVLKINILYIQYGTLGNNNKGLVILASTSNRMKLVLTV